VGGQHRAQSGAGGHDPGDDRSASYWSHIIVYELTDLLALAVTADLPPGHEVLYTAAPDNANGSPVHDLVRRHFAVGGAPKEAAVARLELGPAASVMPRRLPPRRRPS
jgi:hypothetical protein